MQINSVTSGVVPAPRGESKLAKAKESFQNTTALIGVLTLVGGSANAWDLKLSENHAIQFHGFASQGFIATTDYNYLGDTEGGGSFQFGEVGLNATYSPFARTRIAVQGFAFDIGNVGEWEPFLDYASIEYTVNDKLGFRAGRVRRPGGIYNHIQDVDLARTSILLPQGVYDARFRDFSASMDGAEIFGSLSLGKGGGLSYEGYLGLMRFSEKGGLARQLDNTFAAFGGSVTGLDSFLNKGLQLWWNPPVDGLRFGANVTHYTDLGIDYSASHPFFGPLEARSEGSVLTELFSVEYLWRNWTFQAEYQFQASEFDDTLQGPSTSHSDSWYVGAAYRFNSWFEVGTYYSEAYASQGDRNSNPDLYQKDLALSLRFDPKDWWIIKLEGHHIRGTSLLQDDVSNPVRNDDGWFLFAAKTTFSF